MASDPGPAPELSVDELLTTTRSVRKRLDLGRPVPLVLVRECLAIALQAPSGSNRQGWHWLVVTDAGVRAPIGELYARSVRRYLESEGAAGKLFAGDPERAAVQRRVGDSVAWLGERMREVAEVLGLPANVRQGALIPTAYYTGASFRPAARVPLEEVLHLDRW